MVKISLNDSKFVVLVSALLSGVLAFVILRALLTNPAGIIEAIDIQWNQSFAMFEHFFHTWNFYTNGSNIIFASQFPVYGWVLVLRDVALAQRFVYFLTVSLVSFNMFLVAFYTLRKTIQTTSAIYLGSIIASLIYTLNPLMISEIFHISFLWAYSLFPLVFYFGWEAFNASSRKKVLVSALLMSMFFAFMADAWGMLIGLFILVIVAFSSALMNGWKNLFHRFIPNFLLTLLIMGIVTLLLASYWLLPYITQRATEPVWDPFSMTNLVSNSQYSDFTNIFGLRSWNVQPFYPSTLASQNQLLGNASFFSVWQSLALILPIVAVSAVLLRRNKFTLSLSGLFLIGVFLATGARYILPVNFSLSDLWPPPIGEFYKWIAFYSPRIIPNQTFLLKYPYIFIAIVSLAVALLSAFLVAEIFRRINLNLKLKQFSVKSHAFPTVLFLSLISLIALVGAPLLTGNLNGALSPVTLPDQYKELNAFFSSQNGSFRVMYVPQEANFNWSANPWANKIEFWGSGATPLMYGWGISASPNTGFLGDLIYDYLSTNQTQYLGKLLALGNVRFIVLHNDSKGNPALANPAFDNYFTKYREYFNWFLYSSNYTDYYLTDWTNSTTDSIMHYSNFTAFQNYSENYTNSNNNVTLSDYLKNYKNSPIYQNLQNSEAYLNNVLHSKAYHDYLENYLNSAAYQKFMDSSIYNNTHDYLNSSEYLILTGTQYFQNFPEYKNFMNSPEYRTFLYYYLVSSNEYKNFQGSIENAEYQIYLNYNLNYKIMCSTMLNNLQSQKDLKLVTIPYKNDNANLFVYENIENMNYYQAFSKANLVVGGLDTIASLSSIKGFYLNDSAYLFAENQGMSESNLTSFLDLNGISKNVIFYNNKTIDDLVFDTFGNKVLVAPSDIFIDTSQVGWLKEIATSFSWTPLTLSNFNGKNASGKYDFSLGHNLLYTKNSNKSLTFSVNVDKPGEHEIWARLLFSPSGGNLSLSISVNGNYTDVGYVNTNTTIVNAKTNSFSVVHTTETAEKNTIYTLGSIDIVLPPIHSENPLVSTTTMYPDKTYINTTSSYLNNSKIPGTEKTFQFNIPDNSTSTKTDMTSDFYNETTVAHISTETIITDKMNTTYANGNTTTVTNTDKTRIDNYNITSVNAAYNSILGGFKWVQFGNIRLDPGTYTINMTNENGELNAVNLVALPTVSDLEEHRQNVLDLLNQSNARIVYVMDKALLGSLAVGGNLLVPFDAPEQSLYNINLKMNPELNELKIAGDNKELKCTKSSDFAGGENWYSTGPIDLSQGTHNITLSNASSLGIEKIIIYSSNMANGSTESLQKILGGGAEPFVVSYEKTDPVSFSVVVNASKPFILGYQEPYDEFWQSNISSAKLILNSVNNGFFVEPNSTLNTVIGITYSPEQSLQLGVKITLISFLATLAIIGVVLLYPTIRQHRAAQKKPSTL
jgi:hypothetical protein